MLKQPVKIGFLSHPGICYSNGSSSKPPDGVRRSPRAMIDTREVMGQLQTRLDFMVVVVKERLDNNLDIPIPSINELNSAYINASSSHPPETHLFVARANLACRMTKKAEAALDNFGRSLAQKNDPAELDALFIEAVKLYVEMGMIPLAVGYMRAIASPEKQFDAAMDLIIPLLQKNNERSLIEEIVTGDCRIQALKCPAEERFKMLVRVAGALAAAGRFDEEIDEILQETASIVIRNFRTVSIKEISDFLARIEKNWKAFPGSPHRFRLLSWISKLKVRGTV